MWRALKEETSGEITAQFSQLFAEFGPPESLLTDNGTVFHSRELRQLLEDWEVEAEFSCAYRPQGNAVVERVHRTIKRSVARTRRGVEEAVFWHNNTRGGKAATPYEMVFAARSKKPNVSPHREEIERPQLDPPPPVDHGDYRECERNPFSAGDLVYLRNPGGRCYTEWSGPHRVTSVFSSVAAEVGDDGIPRHVSHLRKVPPKHGENDLDDSSILQVSDDSSNEGDNLSRVEEHLSVCSRSSPRRSHRERRRPPWWDDYNIPVAVSGD